MASAESPRDLQALARDLARGERTSGLDRVYAGTVELFRAQARAHPEAPCVTSGTLTFSYREIEARVGAIAATLLEQGVRAGDCVPILGGRDGQFLAAMLGTLAAGAVYVPLDPLYPTVRLSYILEQLDAAVLLTSGAGEECAGSLISERPGLRRLRIQEIQCVPEQAEPPTDACEAGDAAYVIFTSGSTGDPKGAVIDHGGMVNHLMSKIVDLRLTAADRVAQTASQCFDISVWQFLVAPLLGAAVHVYRPEQLMHPLRFMERLRQDGITVLEIVPSYLRAVLDVLDASPGRRPALPSLRWLLLTGEALPPELCRRWRDYYPSIPVVNAYGPTECSDDVTHHIVSAALPAGAERVPIGRPILNTHLYLCDEELSPVPPGGVGEICVGGAGVGRGYLRDPAKTASAFVPNPFDVRAGLRLYRTGDLARRLPDGSFDLLGRADLQIKYRGFRVELLEIERVLCRSPGVDQAAVAVLQRDSDDAGLVAFVVPAALSVEDGELVDHLRDHCRSVLPPYLVPSRFRLVRRFPLTVNGKLDRAALAAMAAGGADAEH